MTRPALAALFSLLLLGLPVGCDQGPGSVDDDVQDDDDDDTPYVKPGPWQDMDFLQRLEYMEEVVQPTLEELFVAAMPEEYDGLACSDCHGEDPADGDYAMPNGLDPLSLDDFPLEDSEDPEIVEFAIFMNDEVKPVMAELLDQEPFPQGSFGCFECHEQD